MLVAELGREVREARIAAGLSQQTLARAAGLSHPTISRIERGRAGSVPIARLARLLSLVGLDLTARAYPRSDALRDAAHERLLGQFLAYVGPPLTWRREVPLPARGDPRAWDALIAGSGESTAVEAETRVVDAQALQRRLQIKLRDGGAARLILLVADTRTNRAAIREAAFALADAFPLAGRRARSAGGGAASRRQRLRRASPQPSYETVNSTLASRRCWTPSPHPAGV